MKLLIASTGLNGLGNFIKRKLSHWGILYSYTRNQYILFKEQLVLWNERLFLLYYDLFSAFYFPEAWDPSRFYDWVAYVDLPVLLFTIKLYGHIPIYSYVRGTHTEQHSFQ
jgi:hypothetical protein